MNMSPLMPIGSGFLDDTLTGEHYDPYIRNDILRPASTRSKIVVNLERKQNKGQRNKF